MSFRLRPALPRARSLEHRGIGVLEEGWAHSSDSIDFIAMDDEELVFVDAATKCGGYDMPREEPNQERFERIAAAYLWTVGCFYRSGVRTSSVPR